MTTFLAGRRRRLVRAAIFFVAVGTLALASRPAGAAELPTAPGTDRGSSCAALARGSSLPPAPSRVQREWIDRCVRLNQIQVVGTHNSFHVQPSPGLFSLLTAFDPLLAMSLEYTHRPLTEQLELGMRQLELDVFADPAGGLYADPVGQQLAPGPPVDPGGALLSPGFKVLHVQDIDFRTRCLTLVACLTEVRAWSDAHPEHVPIMILIETKDDPIPDPGLGFVVPLPIGAAELDALDAEIRSVFPASQLVTPDAVRGDHATLADAVTTDGWPLLGDSRGKVLFTLDNTDERRDVYLDGRPSLEGRAMFVSSEPPAPSAAFVKLNDPVVDSTRIRALVAAGFVVRTRADADTIQARTGDIVPRDAALASGAQWVSTDYPDPSPFGTGYVVRLPDGLPARCNPVLTWAGCRSLLLE